MLLRSFTPRRPSASSVRAGRSGAPEISLEPIDNALLLGREADDV